jgi:competence/damage-inducible protein CinA-like protein
MKTFVINTGTEILLGDVVNTHLAFMAREILPLGLRIDRQLTVPDGPAIREALLHAFGAADLIFVTGGLGPTSDDLTREITAEFLDLELKTNPIAAEAISRRLKTRGLKMNERIARQAFVPRGAVVLPNEHGTAPGLYLAPNINADIPSPHLFLLPGPPRELRPMFLASVLPLLRKQVSVRDEMECRIYRLAGTGESLVEEAIGEKLLALAGLEVGYCARPGEVDLRILGEPALLLQADTVIRQTFGRTIFSTNRDDLEQVLIRLLSDRKETVATAESCTGGLLAHRLTNVPGSSAAFLAGFVTYANRVKESTLGLAADLITRHGAVSKPVARAMAEGARERAGATHALATTGIAGPSGGSKRKPVGTVFVALASAEKEPLVRRFLFPNDRETFKQQTAQAAFDLLRQRLLGFL